MRKFTKDSRAEFNTQTLVGALIVLGIIVAALFIGGVGPFADDDASTPVDDTESTPTEDELETTTEIATMYKGDTDIDMQTWAGAALNDSYNVVAYLTKEGAYESAYEAETALASANTLEVPWDGISRSPVASIDADGKLVFKNVYASAEGTAYDIYIKDTDSGVGAGQFCSEYGTIVFEGKKNEVTDVESVSVILTTESDFDSTITLFERGDMTFENSLKESVVNLTADMDENGEVSNEEFTAMLALSGDDSKVYDVAFYFAEVDDYVGDADITIESITIGSDVVKFEEVADVDDVALGKNKPTVDAGAGDATQYVVTGYTLDLSRIDKDTMDRVPITVEYSCDASDATATNSVGRIEMNAVSFALNKDTDQETAEFIFITGESEATTGYQ